MIGQRRLCIIAVCAWFLALPGLGPALGQPRFETNTISDELLAAGISDAAVLAVYGIRSDNLYLSSTQRRQVTDELLAQFPRSFTLRDQTRLSTLAPFVGVGSSLADDAWQALTSDGDMVAGLIFFDVDGVHDNAALVTPRILLRDGGRHIYFQQIALPLDQAEGDGARLEAVLASLADRVSAKLQDVTTPIAIAVQQENILAPSTTKRDCRDYVSAFLKAEILKADQQRYIGTSERRWFVSEQGELPAIRITLLNEPRQAIAFEAEQLGLVEPLTYILPPSHCEFASWGWADLQGTLLERLIQWSERRPSRLTIKVESPPIRENQPANFSIESDKEGEQAICLYLTNDGEALLLKKPFDVGVTHALFPGQTHEYHFGFAYVDGGRAGLVCVAGSKQDLVAAAIDNSNEDVAMLTAEDIEAWLINKVLPSELVVRTFEYHVVPQGGGD